MSLASVLLVLAAVSAAELPVVHGEMDARRVALEIILLGQAQDRPLLLGVRGAKANAWRDYAQGVQPGLPLLPIDLPAQGDLDVEMALAMGKHGRSCALSLEPLGEDRWRVGLWGGCSPRPGVLPPVAAPASTAQRVAANFVDDPRRPEDLAADLTLALVDEVGRPDSGDEWGLADGTRYELSTLRFALQVGDQATVRRLERERSGAPYGSAVLGFTGSGLSMIGTVAMFAGFSEAESASNYQHIVSSQNVGWAGVLFLGAGQLVLSAIPFHRHGITQRRLRPDQSYERREAEGWVDAYNSDLARELGVGEPDSAEEAP